MYVVLFMIFLYMILREVERGPLPLHAVANTEEMELGNPKLLATDETRTEHG